MFKQYAPTIDQQRRPPAQKACVLCIDCHGFAIRRATSLKNISARFKEEYVFVTRLTISP